MVYTKTIYRSEGDCEQMDKLGILACFNNSGIGYDAKEITEHLDIQEVAVVPNMHKGIRLDWVKDRNYFLMSPPMVSQEEIIEWLDTSKITKLITIEHPYSFYLLDECKKRKIETFNVVNWEGVDTRKGLIEYDHLICKVPFAEKRLKELGFKNVIYLPYPLATEKFSFKQRIGKPKHFLHISGFGGFGFRKNTELVIRAFASTKLQARLTVLSQINNKGQGYDLEKLVADINDSRIHLEVSNNSNENFDLYGSDIDVAIQPSTLEGYGLSIVEPMMKGIPVITTGTEPMSDFMFEPYLIKPERIESIRDLPHAVINQNALRKKIEEIADRDISEDSLKVRKITEGISWAEIGTNWTKNIKGNTNTTVPIPTNYSEVKDSKKRTEGKSMLENMRILWLDWPGRYNRFDNWLYAKFAEELEKNVDALYFYTPEYHKFNPALTPIPYDVNLPMQEIVKQLKIDVIIMDTRSAMYDDYLPASLSPDSKDKGICWLPKDFAKTKAYKVCLEMDFHYESSHDWYKEMGIQLMLQRHYSQAVRKVGDIETLFLPFSVDTKVFQPSNLNREKRFCLAGDMAHKSYAYRRMASGILAKEGLVDIFTKFEKVGDKYIECLQHYISHISCGSQFSITPAKTFEIMASGSVLFSNKFMGIEKVLDEGSYVTYENDGSDVLEKAQKILKDDAFVKDITGKALNCINTRHTHEVRIKELLKILKDRL